MIWTAPGHKGHIVRPNGPRGQPSGMREVAREPRVGVMLHYDGSRNDQSTRWWFEDPRAWRVGYAVLVLDDGSYWTFGSSRATNPEAAYDMRCYHAGRCAPSDWFTDDAYEDANSAFIGISVAATNGDVVPPRSTLTVALLALDVFRREGWLPGDVFRVTGHEDEAWPRGRKIDPTGRTPGGSQQMPPVLDINAVRHLVKEIGT